MSKQLICQKGEIREINCQLGGKKVNKNSSGTGECC